MTGSSAAAGRISAIVPCRNEAGSIRAFVDDVLGQTGLTTPLEIIIADGMSTDGTWEILEGIAGQQPRIVLVRNAERTVSFGLNAAIAMASGEYIVRLDVHARYAPDYVAQCLAVMTETGAQNVGGAARTEVSGLVATAIAAAYASPFAVGMARFHFADYEGPVDTVTYGFWRKADLLRWGLFDVELDRNQDDELNARIRAGGGVIWQSRRIRSWYKPRRQLGDLFRQYFQYGYWKTVVIRKHGRIVSWRHVVPALAVVGVVVGVAASAVYPPCRVVALAPLAAYLAFILTGSVVIASRKGWRLLGCVAPVLICFHVAYGTGFLLGVANGGRRSRAPMVSDLTR
jgi:succinoglycan biosynthesis protein ExoA